MKLNRRCKLSFWPLMAAVALFTLYEVYLMQTCSSECIECRVSAATLIQTNPVLTRLDHSRIIIGVVADETQLHHLGRAAMRTWIQDSPWKVQFFVGGETNTEGFDNVVKLDCQNEYPPIKKVFGVWDYFYRHREGYDWFVQMDADSYLNVEKMSAVLQSLAAEGHRYHYVGSRGLGRENERDILGLNGKTYCVGMGYIIGRAVLNRFGNDLFECLLEAKTNHSDTELARCIYRHNPTLECTESPVPFQPVYYRNVDGVIHGRNFMETMQMSLDIQPAPPTNHFSAALVHPFKKPEFFYMFHEQAKKGLRPVLSPVIKLDSSASWYDFNYAKIDFKSSCVNNPVRQLQHNNIYVKECPSPHPEMPLKPKQVPMFVLNLPDKHDNFDVIYEKFSKMGYHPQRFLAVRGADLGLTVGNLKAGEIGYRETMRLLITYAIRAKLERMIVLDDDAVPHKDFDLKLRELLRDDRCGGYMFTKERGGVLLLGSSIWINGTWPRPSRNMGGWNMINEDMKNSTYDTQCFNACNKTFGSFAVMMHKSVYKPILEWLDASQDPYDWVFAHLSTLGYIVRGAYPNLVIQDVAHESQVDTTRLNQADLNRRAQIHRWKLEDYQLD